MSFKETKRGSWSGDDEGPTRSGKFSSETGELTWKHLSPLCLLTHDLAPHIG
ncbi:Hypothetical protein SMAX5B_013430 [Scophthalmus maximus]|uniref:Uncharacterized protein n=1 Tax=Scophthalmus maximus TaxID=52904 RepID=A0A2U9B5K7_SCOMX|nr:Hypothetical protein SMAX5B_013430 [Scophthalmus maximus]